MYALFFTIGCFWILGVQATQSYTDKPQYWALLERLERLKDQYKFIEKMKLFEPTSIKLDDPFHKILMIEPSIFEDRSCILCRRKSPFKRNLAFGEVNTP